MKIWLYSIYPGIVSSNRQQLDFPQADSLAYESIQMVP